MDLPIDISDLTRAGRAPAQPLVHTIVRELVPADFVLLAKNRSVAAVDIKRLSERHHALARLLASGVPEGIAALQLGYTGSRVSIIKASPAFQELLALHSDTKDLEFAEAAASMAGLSVDLLNEYRTRLEDTPEDFTLKELREGAATFLDRTGHGPTAKSVNVNINAEMGDRLEQARNRAKASALGQGDIIEAEVVEAAE